MKAIASVLMVGAMLALVGCSTVPLHNPSGNLSDAELAQCLQYQNQTKVMAERGDHQEQFDLGRKLFIGCTEGRVKNVPEALTWLEKAAKQDDLSANAFLGNIVYGGAALKKHQAGQDWAADEAEAIRYTGQAIDIWEKAGRQGFEKFELENLMDAVNTRGLLLKRIHGDKEGAAKYYCLSIQVTDNVGGLNAAVNNLKVIGKTRTVCK